MDSIGEFASRYFASLYFLEFIVVSLCVIPFFKVPRGTSKFRVYSFVLSQKIPMAAGWNAYIPGMLIRLPIMGMSAVVWLGASTHEGAALATTMILVFAVPGCLLCASLAGMAFSFIEEVEENKQRRAARRRDRNFVSVYRTSGALLNRTSEPAARDSRHRAAKNNASPSKWRRAQPIEHETARAMPHHSGAGIRRF